MTTTIITYGTFNMFHIYISAFLKDQTGMGNILIVGVSADEINDGKESKYHIPFE